MECGKHFETNEVTVIFSQLVVFAVSFPNFSRNVSQLSLSCKRSRDQNLLYKLFIMWDVALKHASILYPVKNLADKCTGVRPLLV